MSDQFNGELKEGYSFFSNSSYELIASIGKGGMGEVWRAKRISSAGHMQNVAVKFMKELGINSGSLDKEALRMSLLVHDNIVPFIDSGTDEHGRYFVAMAHIEGIDLNTLAALTSKNANSENSIIKPVRIPDAIVGFIIFMTLRALSYAHNFDFGGGATGLMHRDISPGNILLNEKEGFVKLADFGVAAVQDSHSRYQIAGKIPYMAPEVLLEEPINCQVDIYSLGIVAYELLTGFNPNLFSSTTSLLGAISEVMLSLDQPLKPMNQVVAGIDNQLCSIIDKMLQVDVSKRYLTAAEVMTDLGIFLFEKGYGPTTGSLADYIKLIKNRDLKADENIKRELRFLNWENDEDPVRPDYKLTLEAADLIKQELNPCRIPNG